MGWGNKEKIAGLASLSSMEAMWNREFCLLDFQKKETCYKVVRRRKYALRKLPLFRAGKIIGGLFQRHPEVESENGMSDPMDDYEVVEDHDKKACKGCGKKSCSGKCKQAKKKKSTCGKCGKKGCSGKCKKKAPPPLTSLTTRAVAVVRRSARMANVVRFPIPLVLVAMFLSVLASVAKTPSTPAKAATARSARESAVSSRIPSRSSRLILSPQPLMSLIGIHGHPQPQSLSHLSTVLLRDGRRSP